MAQRTLNEKESILASVAEFLQKVHCAAQRPRRGAGCHGKNGPIAQEVFDLVTNNHYNC
jgi:hypothetical protein